MWKIVKRTSNVVDFEEKKKHIHVEEDGNKETLEYDIIMILREKAQTLHSKKIEFSTRFEY